MSISEIFEHIGSYFDLSQGSFHVQIYDERFRDYIDFDDEYAEELQQRLPRTSTATLNANVICSYSDVSDQPNDKLLSTNEIDTDLIGMSPSNKSPSIDQNPEIDLYFSNNSQPSNIDVTLLTDTSNSLSRITFTRDVAPYQRQRYQSEICYKGEKIRIQKDRYISRVQGIKNCHDEKYTSVLPEIKIPLKYMQSNQFELVVCIVIEERKADNVTWYLHTQKGFLPAGAETNTPSVNPIHVNIQQSELTEDRNFRLPLRMCQIRGKYPPEKGAVFHVLPSCTVQDLHPAIHESNTPRLICVMANMNKRIEWETLGLSDFIRPTVSSKHKRKRSNDSAEECSYSSNILSSPVDTDQHHLHAKKQNSHDLVT